MGALISEEYRAQQRELHENPAYGRASVFFAPLVVDLIRTRSVLELLDYGAGKCRLQDELRKHGVEVDYHAFDPALEHISAAPEPREAVVCIDVLEHVEPECLDAVLADLRRCTRRVGLFTVHTGAAMKMLPDGRNAHLIQRPASWWLPKLCDYFEPNVFFPTDGGFLVIVEPKS